jgi:iron complex transport system substrate-binding protein
MAKASRAECEEEGFLRLWKSRSNPDDEASGREAERGATRAVHQRPSLWSHSTLGSDITKRKHLVKTLFAAAALLAAASCARAPSPPPPAAPAVPRRIVSLAPSITETLFALGAGERLVGVTAYCDYPPEAAGLPRIGGYDTPNVEVIAALAPDLVIAPAEGTLAAPVAALRRLGLRVEAVEVKSLDDLFAAVARVGALAGREDAGRALAAGLRARADAVRRAVRERPRARALLVLDHDPTIAAARGTFGDALLEAAGAANVAAGATSPYPQLSAESILGLAPEVIVDASMAADEPALREARARARWARLPAARVVAIEPDLLVRPGPRLVDGLERLARALHPEAFGG